MKFRVYGEEEIRNQVLTALDETGWTHAQLEVEEGTLVQLAKRVLDRVEKARQDSPVSPDSRFIQATIGEHDPSGEKFKPFTFEHAALSQALLLLVQIPVSERPEAFQRAMVIIKSQENVYGILFLDPPGQSKTRSHSMQARLRSPDLGVLQRATTEFVAAMNPSQTSATGGRTYSSRGAAVRRSGQAPLFTSEFNSIHIRSVTDEALMTGKAIPIKGRLSLVWHAVNRSSGRVLLLISLLLVGLSAALFAFSPDTGWWAWSEQLAGRLATGAFGALLVDAAIDYTALRQSLLKGGGDVTHGAVVEWTRA